MEKETYDIRNPPPEDWRFGVERGVITEDQKADFESIEEKLVWTKISRPS